MSKVKVYRDEIEDVKMQTIHNWDIMYIEEPKMKRVFVWEEYLKNIDAGKELVWFLKKKWYLVD